MRKIYFYFKRAVFYINNLLYSIFILKNIRIFLNNHLTIGLKSIKESQAVFPHPIGIVIGQRVKLGKNVTIYQNVTIGSKDTLNYKTSKYPIIGDNVIIYPNSIILGGITIGDNAIIGAGSLVLKDVEKNTVVAGVPARLLKQNIDEGK